MRDLLLKLYLKILSLFKAYVDFIRLIKFMYYLNKEKIFGKGNPILILDVIQKFISLEYPDYTDKIIKSRSSSTSSTLLTNLVCKYKESYSKITLNQILTVLKEDFIERDLK